MKYRIGLDIGIASVGWSVVEHDMDESPARIVDLGVRLFDPAENPKDGSSPCVDRRSARGRRRLLRRKKQRLERLNKVLLEFLGGNVIDFSGEDIYQLRVDALDKCISKNDIARIMYFFAKHRGFKSNKTTEEDLKDCEKITENSSENHKAKLCAEKNSILLSGSPDNVKYRTIGEMLCKNDRFFEIKTKIRNGEEELYISRKTRNKSGSYENTMMRTDILKEVSMILQSQQQWYSDITDEFIKTITTIIESQRSFDEGPANPSKYRVDFESLVKNCTFIQGEKCAPKGTFSYEYFVALQDLNNLKINNKELDSEQKKKLKVSNF